MRAAATAFSWAMRAASDDSRAAISARVEGLRCARSRAGAPPRRGRCARRRPFLLGDARALDGLRAMISALSIAWSRSISRARVASSLAMRAVGDVLVLGDVARFRSPRGRRCRPPRATRCARSRGCASSARAMRSALTAGSCAMRALAVDSRAAISAALQRALLFDLASLDRRVVAMRRLGQ